MPVTERPGPRDFATRAALLYAVLGGGWIVFSDQAVAWLTSDPELIVLIGAIKGLAFIAATALALWWLLRRHAGIQLAHQAQAERLRAMQLLATISDGSDDAIFAKDLSGRYILFNRAAGEFVGKPVEAVLGRDDRALFPAAQAESLMAIGRQVIADKRTLRQEEILATPAGKRVFLSTFGPLHDDEGQVLGLFGIARDITAAKESELALLRANRVLRTLGECHRALACARDEAGLLDEICRRMIEFGGYRLAWVGYAGTDAARTVRPVAQAGFEDGYLAAIALSWADDEYGRGPTGTAIRERHPVVARDIRTDPRYAAWCEAALQRGYNSSIALPLPLDDQSCLGALNIYAAEADAFNAEEVAFLTDLANDLAHGIRTLRDRAARDAAEAALEYERGLLKSLLQTMPDCVWLKDPEGVYLACNPRFERFVGAEEADIIGKTDYDLVDQELAERFRARDRAAIAAGKPSANEEEVTFASDGHRELLETIKTPMFDGNGRLIGVLGIARDVTAARWAQEALRKQGELFKDMSAMARIGAWEIDPVTQVGSWTEEAAKIYGVEPGQEIDLVMAMDCFRGPWRQQIETAMREAIEQGRSFDLELEMEPANGQRKCVRIIGHPVSEGDRIVNLRGAIQDISERKRAVEALRESEERYRTVLAALGEGVYGIDGTGRCMFVNAAALAMLGYAEEEVLGQNQHALFHHHRPDGLPYPAEECPIYQTARDGQTRHQVEWFFRKDGSLFPVELVAAPMEVAGERTGAVVSFMDVTEIRRSEQALRESEAMFRSLSESARDAIILLDAQGRIAHWNPGAERLFGYSRAEIMGKMMHAILPIESERARADAGFANFRLTGQGPVVGRTVELEGLHKDGHRIIVELALSAVKREDGWNAIGIVRDVTVRRASEVQLRKLAQAVEQSTESVAITNLEAEIEYVNESFVQNTGYSRDEVLGRNPRILQSGKTPPETYQALWAALSQGRPWKGQFINKRKDGSEYAEFAIITPLRQLDGKVTHYVAVKEDITEKKRMGEELDRHRHHLQQMIEERTLQLVEARDRAEAATRAKSAFLANMSHEIRTPMNAILGMTHLLMRNAPSPQQVAQLDKIDTAGHHLLGLINDILDISKIEAGRLVLEQTDFAIAAIPRNVASMVADQARVKGLQLRVETDPLPTNLRGDPTRLSQALLNLATNAIKFTKQGSVTLRARKLEEDEAGLLLRFEVEDTG
ncbi:MAG: PAS domain S-box protein, partial [Hydrogenophilaceae bacterium]